MGYETTRSKINNRKENMPPMPLENNPLEIRLRGGYKTSSQWSEIAQDAEKENKWGDAYYYWLASSSASTGSLERSYKIREKSLESLRKWRENT